MVSYDINSYHIYNILPPSIPSALLQEYVQDLKLWLVDDTYIKRIIIGVLKVVAGTYLETLLTFGLLVVGNVGERLSQDYQVCVLVVYVCVLRNQVPIHLCHYTHILTLLCSLYISHSGHSACLLCLQPLGTPRRR